MHITYRSFALKKATENLAIHFIYFNPAEATFTCRIHYFNFIHGQIQGDSTVVA